MFNMVDEIFSETNHSDIAFKTVCKEISYGQLIKNVNRFANFLDSYNLIKGDKVLLYSSKGVKTIVSILGIIKSGAVFCPTFSTTGKDLLKYKISDLKPKLIITEKKLYNKNKDLMDGFSVVLLDGKMNHEGVDIYDNINKFSENYTSKTESSDIATIHYTSGTTSRPKGVIHTHYHITRYIKTFTEVFEKGIKVDSPKNYLCTADHSWITGTTYGVLAPLARGCKISLISKFKSPRNVLSLINDNEINIVYTSPSLLRMIRSDKNIVSEIPKLESLIRICTVGEKLSIDTIDWFYNNYGVFVRDTWFQTETGAIILANDSYAKKGCMGVPISDARVFVLNEKKEKVKNQVGSLVIEKSCSSMFTSYLNKKNQYDEKFYDEYYFTGDLAIHDDDDYFKFYSRDDDIINVFGHLVSPLEIERAIINLDEVLDAIVFGELSEKFGEKIVAKVVIDRERFNINDQKIKRLIQNQVKKSYSNYGVPQEVYCVRKLDKTDSGKKIRK